MLFTFHAKLKRVIIIIIMIIIIIIINIIINDLFQFDLWQIVVHQIQSIK